MNSDDHLLTIFGDVLDRSPKSGTSDAYFLIEFRCRPHLKPRRRVEIVGKEIGAEEKQPHRDQSPAADDAEQSSKCAHQSAVSRTAAGSTRGAGNGCRCLVPPPRFGEGARGWGLATCSRYGLAPPLRFGEGGRGSEVFVSALSTQTPPPNPLPEAGRGNKTKTQLHTSRRPHPPTPSPKRGGGTKH